MIITSQISPLERSEKDRVLPRRNSGEAQFGRGAIRARRNSGDAQLCLQSRNLPEKTAHAFSLFRIFSSFRTFSGSSRNVSRNVS